STTLAVEVGEGQAEAVGAMLREGGFAAVETRRDLAGIERVVLGRGDSLRYTGERAPQER
ncbi:MAG TPA: hypothetical protein VFP23_09500, partial [Solirubrobacterales bacterium]|nr:hypothetical protein [Solirubrobacterales bacterium]